MPTQPKLEGLSLLIAKLLYGTGMQLTEAISFRVKDVDFDQNLIVVRDGKGFKDQTVPLPQRMVQGFPIDQVACRCLRYQIKDVSAR